MMIRNMVWRGCVCLMVMAALTGCKNKPEYARPLPPGAPALRKLAPDEWPDLRANLMANSSDLQQAVRKCVRWFSLPSVRQFFPVENISHEHAQASVVAFDTILRNTTDPAQALRQLHGEFDLYESVGWNGEGIVLYTAYYTPIVKASRTPDVNFRYPLYNRPPDLVSDPATGQILGRQTGGAVLPYPSRSEIESSNMLAGQELVWLADPFERYLVQLQGSARLELTDGTSLNIGYAGSNGREYTSIARILADEGKLDINSLSLPAVRDYFHANPDDLDRYTSRNERYVFFKEYTSEEWPAGSLGFAVTPLRSLATDKEVFPRGGVVLVDTKLARPSGQAAFQHLMVDQDTGGAIRAPGRADIYMGIGPKAEDLAGRQYAEGRLYYFFLKPERVGFWRSQIAQSAPTK